METVNELNAKILEITILIQNKYPELSKYLLEMPITIPIVNKPKIDEEILRKYYYSLEQMVKNYLLENPNY